MEVYSAKQRELSKRNAFQRDKGKKGDNLGVWKNVNVLDWYDE